MAAIIPHARAPDRADNQERKTQAYQLRRPGSGTAVPSISNAGRSSVAAPYCQPPPNWVWLWGEVGACGVVQRRVPISGCRWRRSA